MLQRSLPLVILSLLLSSAAHAQLRNHDLRFVPPADTRVIGFHVYVSANSMSYADWRDDVNFVPSVDASGTATYRLSGLEAYDDVYITMKSYDATGVESGFSNEIVLPALSSCSATSCSDGNPCTRDSCTATGCVFDPVPLVGSTCNDGNATTFDDVCGASGVCAGTPGQCSVDADCPASTNPCAGPRLCSNHVCVDGAPRADGTTCSDGNEVTRYDVCESGTCRGYACGSDAHCGDGEACNGIETCSNRVCVAGTPMVCGDGNVCNGSESCRASTCVAGVPLACPAEDGPCFDAFCDASLGCRVELHPEGSTCTTSVSGLSGQCESGVCVADEPPPVDEEPQSCDAAYGPPTSIRQVISDAPETSRKIVWSAPLNPLGSVVEYRKRFTRPWTTLHASPESTSGCDATWSATLVGLDANATYDYRVSGASEAGRVWSDVYAVRTGPTPGTGKFRFAFFAGNGLAASAQSPQADDVLQLLNQAGFPLVLGGGGYALSSEAIASGAVASTRDALAAWKRQASVVTSNAIFAPVLGDTELSTLAQGEHPSDYAEFMRSASGAPDRGGNYSFDAGGVHFAALQAPALGAVHPSTTEGAANLAWLDADLAAARAAGTRWLVVYMHADVFSSERIEAGSAGVRSGLGAVLQRHGVNLVLSGAGNSFERTRPLRGSLEDPTVGSLAWRIFTASDGIVFWRSGSGGRTAFGSWAPVTPAWSAFRENASATYVGVSVSSYAMNVVTYAVDSSGARTVLHSIEIR